jgi:hypothetical protein
MSHPSKVKGWADELRDRQVYLQRVWPAVDSHPNSQHPTKDHGGTGTTHVQSKKRKTWNIKDVVRWMFDHTGDDPWFIIYSDGDKRKKDAIKEDVVILPAEQYIEERAELERYRGSRSPH